MKKLILFLTLFISNISFTYAQWQNTNCPSLGYGVYSLAASGRNIFAGTQEGGLFLSTDTGTTWRAANNGFIYPDVWTLAIKGKNIFAGSSDDLYLSADTAASWIARGLTNDSVTLNSFISLATNGASIFAGTIQSGVYISTDTGTSWDEGTVFSVYVNSIAISGTNIFAGTDGNGVFLSTNNGSNWAVVSNGLTVNYGNEVRPLDILSLAISGANIFAGTNDGIFLSIDNGVNWTSVNNGIPIQANAGVPILPYENVYSLAVSGRSIYAGVSGYNSSGIYNNGDVYLSTDSGASWKSTGLINNHSAVLSLAINGADIFAGSGDGEVWKRPLNGTVQNCGPEDIHDSLALVQITNQGGIVIPVWDCNNPSRLTGLQVTGLIGSLDVSNCTSLTYLYCEYNQITTLDGSNCTSLQTLDCWNSQITDIDLTGCSGLEYLYCEYNQLTSLDVTDCTALKILDCWNNQLATLDASGCASLTTLYCEYNQLTDLEVSDCTSLDTLGCWNNQLTTLDVSGLTSLVSLACDSNQLTSINASGCTSLPSLVYVHHQLQTLNASGCTSLQILDCWNNQLTDIDVSGDTALKQLYCEDNQLTILDVGDCFSLVTLACWNNQLATLDVSNFASLTQLACDSNHLKTLNVSGCTSLKNLYCWNNQLADLDVSSCIALDSLACYFNQLTNLNVGGCNSLISIGCWYNQLTDLDVSGLSSLKYLKCENNQLTNLDVSDCTSLDTLSCRDNQLTDLDLSDLSSLKFLWCWDNQLTNINLRGLDSLVWFWCYNNQLATLNLNGLSSLQILRCDSNQLTAIDARGCNALTSLKCNNNQLNNCSLRYFYGLNIGCNINSTYYTTTEGNEAGGSFTVEVPSVLQELDLRKNKCFTLNAMKKLENNLTCATIVWDSTSTCTDSSSSDISANLTITPGFCTTPGLATVHPDGGIPPYSFLWSNGNTTDSLYSHVTKTYTVTIEDTNQCSVIDTAAIFVNPPPSPNFLLFADSTQLHHYIAINNATGLLPLRYDWSWGDTSLDDTIPYPSHTYANTGFYTICLSVTDSTGCTNSFCDSSFHALRTTNTMVYVNVVSPVITGINDANVENVNPIIYPNPASSQLTIHTSSYSNQQTALISIINVLGEEVLLSDVLLKSGEDAVLDISKLSTGIYFLQLKSENWSSVKRFVKE